MDGWLVLDKPSGVTSTRVGAVVKKVLGAGVCEDAGAAALRGGGFSAFVRRGVCRIGHVGTLDPLATGVLVLAVGEATKLVPYLEKYTCARKGYDFSVVFGISTDTLDLDGQVVQRDTKIPRLEGLQAVCERMLGEQLQVPPVFSALRINGRRSYELARSGCPQEPKARAITIHSLRLNHFDTAPQAFCDLGSACASFSVECSGGTYVRSLARDVAEKLGCLATVIALRRTQDRIFPLQDAFTLDFLRKIAQKGMVRDVLIPMEFVLDSLPEVLITDEFLEKLRNGAAFQVSRDTSGLAAVTGSAATMATEDGLASKDAAAPGSSSLEEGVCVRVKHAGRLLGIGVLRGELCFPKRVLNVF
jgi:tRNA pseudouridine55 synthase